jgi:ribosome-binding factor A
MRGERLAEEIHRELADILLSRVRDPRLGLATVTRVEVSSDGSHARILVSFLGDEAADDSGLRALESAAAFIRGELGRRLEVRRVPELAFRADPGMRHSVRIQAELHRLDLAREEAGAPRRDDTSGAEAPARTEPGATEPGANESGPGLADGGISGEED